MYVYILSPSFFEIPKLNVPELFHQADWLFLILQLCSLEQCSYTDENGRVKMALTSLCFIRAQIGLQQ